MESAHKTASALKADLDDCHVSISHLKQRLEVCEVELEHATQQLASARSAMAESDSIRIERDAAAAQAKRLEADLRDEKGVEKDLREEINHARRESTRREGVLKIAMSQWESLLDLYIGDFVPNSSVAPPPSRDDDGGGGDRRAGRGARSDSVASIDWRKSLQDASVEGGLQFGKPPRPHHIFFHYACCLFVPSRMQLTRSF